MAPVTLRWFRRTATGAVAITLFSLVWNFSARVPVVRNSQSRWVPLAFSTDGQIIAAADLTTEPQVGINSLIFPPGGPIHLLRAADLTLVSLPIETPVVVHFSGTTYHPPLEIVEFSPKGDLLAVIQPNRDAKQLDTLELHLIRLPGGNIWKSLPVPYDRFQKDGGIARRLFSANGHLLAWHEYSQETEGFNGIRVWDVVEERERFVIALDLADGALDRRVDAVRRDAELASKHRGDRRQPLLD